ncbi:hypothetical protein I6F11_20520 [Ensifer sp. NBAIM29]|nr:hypothetical protein [Ensifer sp. NBAIM29]
MTPIYADFVTEAVERNGIVRLSFAAITQDGDGIPKADIMLRLRLPKEAASNLRRSLEVIEGTNRGS